MKNLLTSDVTVRAIKTFVQAFLATVAVGVVGVNSIETAQALAIAAVAAAVSATWNFVVKTS